MTLVCYLDDSGTDKENSLVTMAGYIGTADSWRAFEESAHTILDEHGISIVHAKELYSNDGEFAGWSIDKKCKFIQKLNAVLAPRVGLAISFSTLKNSFKKRQEGRTKTQSPYGFCFSGVIDRLLKDDGFMKVVKQSGVNISFAIEDGNKNNNEILQRYMRLKEKHGSELSFLSDMAFVKKNSSIAIQMADLFAFFTRRHAVAMEKNNREPIEHHRYLTTLRMGIRDVGFAATDFGYGDLE